MYHDNVNFFLKKDRQQPLIIAHRGASADRPENTLAAFAEAIDQQADAIELDVQLSRDKELVVIHDPFLGRTTDGRGRVSRQLVDYIRTRDAGSSFHRAYSSERVPTITEVLKKFGSKTNYVVELKFYQFRHQAIAEQTYQAVRAANLLNHTIFLSFDPRILWYLKKLDPQVAVMWAFIPILGILPPKQLVRQFDALGTGSKVSVDYIKRLNKYRKPINVWNGRTENITESATLQVAMLTTNYPAKLREALTRARRQP